MSMQNLGNILTVSARILLAFAFVFGQTALAGQSQNGKDKPNVSGSTKTHQQSPSNPSPIPAAKSQPAEEESGAQQSAVAEEKVSGGGGQHEGIKVHGHWTIEVRNPDGTVVTHREFENALQPSGASTLAAVLSRASSVGFWEVRVFTGTTSGPNSGPCSSNGNPSLCIMDESAPGYSASPISFPTLTVSNVGGNSVVLTGNVTAALSVNIQNVETFLNLCPNTVAPSSPCLASALIFTAADSTSNPPGFTGVGVSPGQTIAVTVVISFS